MSRLSRGFFIVLEGIDGAGKTTLAKMLIDMFKSKGMEAVYTYEPTDSLIVRAVKGEYSSYRDAYVDALAFALDRLIHVKTLIQPMLEKGVCVVSDRYFYSSIAYQSAMGAPFEWVVEVNKYALKPDLAIYLDIPPEVAMARRQGLPSRFPEFEEKEFLNRVRQNYKRMVAQGWLLEVDATREVQAVYSEVLEKVRSLFSSGMV
ncbi:dTMP kinase [Thermosphaera chiliense]|uniref:Probable thymidylate kinase n=1 Tax=Thermosphaera chiliense TaxID=3402707 RepID=A0A7M1URT2_9CREN|nr:dTMP kinase [Thermosphaera aggregans]QOR94990.1 dTMP kinase [Thermosphaera aggregans]